MSGGANGFTDGKIEGVQVLPLTRHLDERGFLVETWREDSLEGGKRPVMSYLSCTEPGVARGPHEHRGQTDLFAFIGPGNFKIHLWDNRPDSPTFARRMVLFAGADRPAALVVPPGVVHGYRNISRTERGMVLNYPDALYAGWERRETVDEIRHEDQADRFYLDFVQGLNEP